MEATPQTIEQLIAELKPVRAIAVPGRMFLHWLLASMIITVPLVLLGAHRADLATQLHKPLFLAEIAVLAGLILSCGLASVWLCYPDLRQQPWVVALPVPFLLTFAGLSLYRYLHPAMTTVLPEDAGNDFSCIACILFYGAVPAACMFYRLCRHAPVYPRLAGGIALLASTSIGMLVLKLAEANDAVSHLLVWHVVPIIILVALGSQFGSRVFRW